MNQHLNDAIRELANSSAVKKSKIGRIRQVLPEIELAQKAGVRLADIAHTLSTQGFEGMNLKCLQNLMYQSRRGGWRSSAQGKIPLVQPVIEVRERAVVTEGIHAESILEDARKAMQTKPAASSITLGLLRSSQLNQPGNERK